MMFANVSMAVGTMAFSISVSFPGGGPHLEPQIAQNQTVPRNRCLNLAKINPDNLLLVVELNEAISG